MRKTSQQIAKKLVEDFTRLSLGKEVWEQQDILNDLVKTEIDKAYDENPFETTAARIGNNQGMYIAQILKVINEKGQAFISLDGYANQVINAVIQLSDVRLFWTLETSHPPNKINIRVYKPSKEEITEADGTK